MRFFRCHSSGLRTPSLLTGHYAKPFVAPSTGIMLMPVHRLFVELCDFSLDNSTSSSWLAAPCTWSHFLSLTCDVKAAFPPYLYILLPELYTQYSVRYSHFCCHSYSWHTHLSIYVEKRSLRSNRHASSHVTLHAWTVRRSSDRRGNMWTMCG